MEYGREVRGDEVVLTYRQEEDAEPVVFRYERALPRSMRERDGDASGPPAPWRAAMEPRDRLGRSRRRGTGIFVALALVIGVGCIAAGLWRTAAGGGTGDGGSSGQGREDLLPDEYYWEEFSAPNDGEIAIRRYPAGSDVRLTLASSRGLAVLEPGEVYEKVNPSVVTVLGSQGEYGSVGAGIVFDEEGYILTNCHVIAGCDECSVWVATAQGAISERTASLVGYDEDADLAVLKVDSGGLAAAQFGVSDELSIGDKVYAIGNPLGLELIGTFTDGMVSAVDRSVDVDGLTMTLIQTNAALNSGNSGGPLINQYGQVVGINTIKMMSSSDTIEGLGFAIPSSIAVGWVNELLQYGALSPRPVLGLTVSRIARELPDGSVGLEVESVTEGLGADRAGVRPGDCIVAFNGREVYQLDQLFAIRSTLSVGDRVSIRVCRDGDYLDLIMEMMEDPG